jgi:hypothetical protein
MSRRSPARAQGPDWSAIVASLDQRGLAETGPLLGPRECDAVQALWESPERFRSRVDLARHGYGAGGEYRYLSDPLPELVAQLRRDLYPPLARIANVWQQRLGRPGRFPATLAGFLAVCRRAGQQRPTPLILRYEAGGYNCLHQDLYGSVAFPLQVTILLSRPGADFEGGEFLLVEQRPRRQSRGSAVTLRQGEAVIFPNAVRPVQGTRGVYQAVHRHGVAEVRSGVRFTLGIIFHDAR